MSTLRISNIEAKADASSPTVNEKLKFTSSPTAGQDPLLHLDGLNAASGITTIGINTTGNTITIKGNDVNFAGIVTALKFSGPFTDLTINDDLIVSDGLTVSGIATFNNDVELVGPTAGITSAYWDKSANSLIFKDNSKSVFGTDSDVSIYNATNFHIEKTGTTGSGIRIHVPTNESIEFQQAQATVMATFTANGSCSLYNNTVKRIETSGIGVTVTGTIDLDTISKSISKTAVDLFVYDTRKDSDGGAWRKRTGNTSWYNETLGSSSRGSRKEFPAVAVIVAEADTVTIYDGDDPDMPMWMFFEQGNGDGQNRMLNRFMGDIKAISMLNGNLFVCANSTSGADRGGALWINFISEVSYAFGTNDSQAENIYGFLYHNISQRNTVLGTDIYGDKDSKYQLENNAQCNDVAMTVLPNAPIDVSTGLPIPTIAVGTDDGVSVIKDDGNVDDITVSNSGYNVTTQIEIDEKYVYIGFGLSNAYIGGIGYAVPIPPTGNVSLGNIINATSNADFRWSSNSTSGSGGKSDYYINPSDANTDDVTGTVLTKRGMSFGTESGVSMILNEERDTNGSVAYVTKDFNTGWMHGDCKLAALCDTDTTNVSSSNLMSGATYNTSARIDSYSYTNGSSTLVINDQQSSADGYVNLTLGGLTASTTYVMTATADQAYTPTSGYNHHIGNTTDGTVYFEDNFVGTTTTQKITFKTPSSGNPTVVFYSGYNGALTYTLDLRLAELDRIGRFSAYNSGQSATIGQRDGIKVYGTITKTAVATGAELVSYGGFSASNYLEQPYNSDLNWQNNNFSVYGWFKLDNNGTQQCLMMLMQPDGEVDYLLIEQQSNGDMRFQVDSLSGASVAYATTLPTGVWLHYCGVNIDNDKTYLYINGEPTGLHNGVLHGVSTFDNTSAKLTIGRRATANYNDASSKPFTGQMALWRISNTTPSAEQIKKMYNDEKKLFATDAKCTLYGSSSAVTAVAYDDSNDILHAGTSAGRSEFVGLNRINNTTTAVTAAISASNGLVADE